MSISYGTIYKSVRTSSKGASEVDVDAELKKLLQRELNNSIKQAISESMGMGSDKGSNIYGGQTKKSGGITSSGGQSEQMDIDALVAQALAQGVQTTGILRGLFGIVPNLIGR